ncbi:MAG: hypothetical protein Q7S32_01155 [bacterium]|nr:hypothetical protein [bacterium]
MLRILALILVGGAVFLAFNKEKVHEYKRNALETINPALKEKRLIGEIQDNLQRLDGLLSNKNFKPEDTKEVAAIVNNAKQVLSELESTNAKSDLGANLSNLIQKLVPLPDKPSPTWLPPQNCPIN